MRAGLAEAPMAYEGTEEVMAAQADLVAPVTRFGPKLVRMVKGRSEGYQCAETLPFTTGEGIAPNTSG